MRKKNTDVNNAASATNPLIANIVRRIKQQKSHQPRIVVSAADEKVRSKVEKFLHSSDIAYEIKGLPKPLQVDPELQDALNKYKDLTKVEFKSNKEEITAVRANKLTRLQAVLNRTQQIKDALAAATAN